MSRRVLTGPVPADLAGLSGVHDLVATGSRLTCEVDAGRLGTLLQRLTAIGVGTLLSAPPTLEELFLRHYAAAAPSLDPARSRKPA